MECRWLSARWRGAGETPTVPWGLLILTPIMVATTAGTAFAAAPPPAGIPIVVRREFPRLKFSNALLMREAPDGSGRMMVLERFGVIRTFPRKADPAPEEVAAWLDLSNAIGTNTEEGLLGFDFSPDFAETGHVYTFYSSNITRPATSRVSRFREEREGSGLIDRATEEIILEIPDQTSNHLAGHVEFGPDGFLYISTGDGTKPSIITRNSQDTTTLRGKLLRIDPRGGAPYAIPPGNPLTGDDSARPEIYALGLRNPFRFAFDRDDGRLFLADVGWQTREEVNRVLGGENFGWPDAEGTICNAGPPAFCEAFGYAPPLADYPHLEGIGAVIGGRIYRGGNAPALEGLFLCSDYVFRRIMVVVPLPDGGAEIRTLVEPLSGIRPTGWGEDARGEVYIMDYNLSGGGIYGLRQTALETGWVLK